MLKQIMQSQSQHSKLAGINFGQSVVQKPFNYNQYSGIRQNGFQRAYSPQMNNINTVNINTRLK